MARNEGKYGALAEKSHAKVAAEKLRVSLDYLDWGHPDLFFVHGLTAEHYQKIFECMAELGKSTEDQITQQNHPSLFPKSIFNNDKGTLSCFPEHLKAGIRRQLEAGSPQPGVDYEVLAHEALNRAFEVRIGKTYGRLHGFVWDKVFHVIWFDPAHNLYPRDNEGVRGPERYATVKGFTPDDVIRLKGENKDLVDKLNALHTEHDELLEIFAKS